MANRWAVEMLQRRNEAALTGQPKGTVILRGETTWASRIDEVRKCSPSEA